MRRWIKPIAIELALLLTIAFFAGRWAVQQTKQVPEFYARATQTPLESAKACQQMTAGVTQLKNEAGKIGSWRASFSCDEINAWLIEELPKKFPQLLAKGASEPRILIEQNRVLAAVRYKSHSIDTVISCELEVELTEQPNMLALRVIQLKAGALPLPIGNFAKGISKEAAKGDIDIRWDVTEKGPIALVTVPSEHPRYVYNPVIVEAVQLEAGSLSLAGHTGPEAHAAYRPNGPVYQFVSYRPSENRNRHPSQFSSTPNRSIGKLR
jgi:hypothetical protein